MEVGVSKFMSNNDEVLEITKDYVNYYNDFDDPIPYKGLFFYPVTCGEYKIFYNAVQCITFDKTKVANKRVFRMNYVDFILWCKVLEDCQYDGLKDLPYNSFYDLLHYLLSLCLHINTKNIMIDKDEDGKSVLKLPIQVDADNFRYEAFDGKDFENFRKLICWQNGVELEEETRFDDPRVKQALDEALAFKNKGGTNCSFDEQIICIMMILGETDKQKIKNNITLNTFHKLLRRYDQIVNYSSYLNGCELKEPVGHWMGNLNKDKYADVVMSYDSVEAQLKGK